MAWIFVAVVVLYSVLAGQRLKGLLAENGSWERVEHEGQQTYCDEVR
jgi:hypothetical protein